MLRRSGIAVSWEIDEDDPPIDPEEIHRLGPARSGGTKGQRLLTGEAIEQRGFANIAPPQEGNFGKRFRWKLLRPDRT
jgi:hypothetical protein